MSLSYYETLGINKEIYQLSTQVLTDLQAHIQALDEIREYNQLRLLMAFKDSGLTEAALAGSSGYGYDDRGREALENVFASYFGAEAALVRQQFSSGTEVLLTCLRGLLRPQEEVLIVTGLPYDTIRPALAPYQEGEPRLGRLAEFGIKSRIVALTDQGELDYAAIKAAHNARTRVVYVQRSRGYERRRALTVAEIAALKKALSTWQSKAVLMVDNCYGEFCETHEPSAVGADVVAGSLLKNPGAGIASSGGYIVGKANLVEEIAHVMTAPSVGSHIGPSLGHSRNIAQGLFFAPRVTCEALKGAVHAAGVFAAQGYYVTPLAQEQRSDIVQVISLGSAEALAIFCAQIQAFAPIDSTYTPIPAPMPGYDCDIIMASGSFVQGSSIELSCDAPLRPPYDVFLQGSLCFENSRLAVLMALQKLSRK